MARYALLRNRKVINIVEADAAWVDRHWVGANELLPDGSPVNIGWQRPVGGGPLEPVAPDVVVPGVLPRRKLLRALHEDGIRAADIEAAIVTLPEPKQSRFRIDWAEENPIERNWNVFNQIMALLNRTPAQRDAIFIAGADL